MKKMLCSKIFFFFITIAVLSGIGKSAAHNVEIDSGIVKKQLQFLRVFLQDMEQQYASFFSREDKKTYGEHIDEMTRRVNKWNVAFNAFEKKCEKRSVRTADPITKVENILRYVMEKVMCYFTSARQILQDYRNHHNPLAARKLAKELEKTFDIQEMFRFLKEKLILVKKELVCLGLNDLALEVADAIKHTSGREREWNKKNNCSLFAVFLRRMGCL